jgi:serine/threonine protein phosphatase PrpC
VQNNVAVWAHAGDSRLYHIRKGAILAQTKDHSHVQQLIDQGRIREEAASAHPERNLIFSCLGSDAPPRLEVSTPTELDSGDTLMLCSDGLWGPLSGKIICAALQAGGITHAIPRLLDEAEQRAGRECDNLSVIALTWE